MSGDTDLGRHLEAYLAIRDALGLAAGTRVRVLRSFLDHARGATAPGAPIRAATALAWACDHAPPGCGDAGKAYRLTVARGFLSYLSGVMPGTEVPAHRLLASGRRRQPYIFSDAEIGAMIAAAANAPPRGTLRPVMLPTLLGLLASTGLRIGEVAQLLRNSLGPSENGRRPAGTQSGTPADPANQVPEVAPRAGPPNDCHGAGGLPATA